MSIKLDSEPVHDGSNKYIKTKMKLYGNKINTNFHAKKDTKRKCIIQVPYSAYKCLIRANKKWYPQTLLEECKCEIKKNKMENLNDDLDLSSSDEFHNESNNGFDNGSDNETHN